MYPSSINRALCSDGMRCIKPLAPSRNETNSSRVNVGADVVILGICASGTRDQETSLIYLPALRIRFLHWPVSDSLPGKEHQRASLSHGRFSRLAADGARRR